MNCQIVSKVSSLDVLTFTYCFIVLTFYVVYECLVAHNVFVFFFFLCPTF